MIRPLLIILPLAALAACGEPSSSAKVTKTLDGDGVGVEVTDAWCRATPSGARTGACYATLRAIGRDDRLIAVKTSAAPNAMVHEVSMDGGVMRMAEVEGGLALPKGKPVALAPGGSHLMLVGLTGPLVAGERVELTLRFAEGATIDMQAPVRAAAAD